MSELHKKLTGNSVTHIKITLNMHIAGEDSRMKLKGSKARWMGWMMDRCPCRRHKAFLLLDLEPEYYCPSACSSGFMLELDFLSKHINLAFS